MNRIHSRSLRCVTGLVIMAVAGGCVTEPPVPSTIAISPDNVTLTRLGATGERRIFRATVKDRRGLDMPGVNVSWSTSDSSVVTVAGDGMVGVVRVAGDGRAIVSASVGAIEGTAAVTVGIGPQLTALLALHRAMGGDDWHHNANWGTDAPLGTWHGVTINAEGDVTELVLGGNELTGGIPVEIGMLEALETLILTTNQLTGAIPPQLGNLQNLRYLALHDNQLRGPIPPALANLPELTILNLDLNALTGPIPAELGSLRNLQILSLGHNDLTGPIPAELGRLQDLGGLHLVGNDLSGPIPPELGGLQNLSSLHLGMNALTGTIPPEFGSLRNLGYLAIDHTALSGRLPRELIGLSLSLFHWNATELCAPTDAQFRDWLASIPNHSGNRRCSS